MNDAQKRVLVVYSRVGGGHLSAARALAAELESSGKATTRLVDAYLECGRFPATLIPTAYARLARAHPRLWSMVYHGSTSFNPQWVLGPFLKGGFEREIAEFGRAANYTGARLEVVLTDWHSVHRFWVARGVSHYSASTESAREDCIRFGAPPASVEVVGIPVRSEFAGGIDRHAARARLRALGLDSEKFTILAMVGAEGSPKALANIAQLAQLNLDAQLLVVSGRNEALRRRVEQLPARMLLRALGFVDNVAELMCAADLLLTKAGGVTLAEAFCSGVPVVVHDVLPGQEAGNLEHVLAQQAVVYAPDPEALARIAQELIHDPSRRAALAERGARLARPQASREIVRGLLERA